MGGVGSSAPYKSIEPPVVSTLYEPWPKQLISVLGVYRHVERYWREMLSSRSQKGKIRWEVFLAIKQRYPLQRPQLSLPYTRLKQYAVL
jgi:hypothetical protein